jgi:hypothetical protein
MYNSKTNKRKKGRKKETVPKKSTGRVWGQTNREQNKHIKEIPGSGTIEFQS